MHVHKDLAYRNKETQCDVGVRCRAVHMTHGSLAQRQLQARPSQTPYLPRHSCTQV